MFQKLQKKIQDDLTQSLKEKEQALEEEKAQKLKHQ